MKFDVALCVAFHEEQCADECGRSFVVYEAVTPTEWNCNEIRFLVGENCFHKGNEMQSKPAANYGNHGESAVLKYLSIAVVRCRVLPTCMPQFE